MFNSNSTFFTFAKLAFALGPSVSLNVISDIHASLPHVVHGPQFMDPLFLLLVQEGVVPWLYTVYDGDLQVLHVPSMLLVEVLSQSPHSSLAILPVAIVPAHKPTLVKCLANIPQVTGFTLGNVNYPYF